MRKYMQGVWVLARYMKQFRSIKFYSAEKCIMIDLFYTNNFV